MSIKIAWSAQSCSNIFLSTDTITSTRIKPTQYPIVPNTGEILHEIRARSAHLNAVNQPAFLHYQRISLSSSIAQAYVSQIPRTLMFKSGQNTINLYWECARMLSECKCFQLKCFYLGRSIRLINWCRPRFYTIQYNTIQYNTS